MVILDKWSSIKVFGDKYSDVAENNICLNVKPLKSVYTFCSKIFDLVNNDVHNGENQPHQDVGDRHVCLNIKPLKMVCTFHTRFLHVFRGYVRVPSH